MHGWFSGKELLIRWKILPINLFEYVKAGLQPYDKNGDVKISPDGVYQAKLAADLRETCNRREHELWSLAPFLWEELRMYDTDYWENMSEKDLKEWKKEWLDFQNPTAMAVLNVDPDVLIAKYIEWQPEYERLCAEIEFIESNLNITNYPWTEYELSEMIEMYDESLPEGDFESYMKSEPSYEIKQVKVRRDSSEISSVLDEVVDSLYLFEDVMEHPREQEIKEYEYLKRYENNGTQTSNEYPVAHQGDRVVNEDIDNTKSIKELNNNEQNAENKFIWNGRSWKIIFEGREIDDYFNLIGFKAIAYILELKGKSIFPFDLMKVVRPSKNDSNLPHFKQGFKEYNYKYCKELAEAFDELYKDPSDANKYRELKKANRDEFKIILKNGTHICIPWVKFQGGNDKDHKKAKNSMEGSIKNAIISLNKNKSCKDLASHLIDNVKYFPTHKGFLYSGVLVWDIDHGA